MQVTIILQVTAIPRLTTGEPEMPTMLDLIRMMARGEMPPPPVATLIGFTLASVEPGRAVIQLDADDRHQNPMGTLHGGILCDIADAAMGMAYAASLDEARRSPRSISRSTSSSRSGRAR